MNWKHCVFTITAIVFAGSLIAQPKVIDRKEEKAEFKDLQVTEQKQEENILITNQGLSAFGHLVEMTKQDRFSAQREFKEPLNFNHTFRYVKYTPRNTYIRFVKECPETGFLLSGIGDPKQAIAEAQEKMKFANARGIETKELANLLNNWATNFKAASAPDETQEIACTGREGVELTQFDFIYAQDSSLKNAIGTRRKSLTLFFKQVNQNVDTQQSLELDLVVTRIVEDDFKAGVKNVEVIIDPTPMDLQMEDVVFFTRYNQKPQVPVVLAAMTNTANFPHRVIFKQKFYLKLLDHFYRLYRLVDGYAAKDGNKFNNNLLEELNKTLSY